MTYVIQTKDLTKKFGNVCAVNNLNLNVPQGAVFGFLGPNGAGKTTTIKMLLGLTKPTSGTISVLGQPASSGQHLPRIGFLPDVPNYYTWMRGAEFLTFCGQLFDIPRSQLKQRVEELLELTNLGNVKTKIGGYSRGMKQRLGLAQAMINRPELLFLDEPTSALDPIGRKEVLETLQQIARDCTIFFSTHILADVERICNRVAVLKQGEMASESSMEDLRRRYAQNALKLEVSGDAASFIDDLQDKDWTQVVEKQNGYILVTAFDQQTAQREIPRLLSEHKLGLRKLEPMEMNLEDIFVRLVNGNEK